MQIGSRLGPYEILALLGAGGMGEVYRALGTPAPLFTPKGKWAWSNFDLSPDGKKILAILPEVVADELPLSVVANWTAELEKR